jgi:SAM-dependent methyltransferase
MGSEKAELRWKRDDGNWIFGGAPVAHTGRETGVLLRLNLLKNLKLGKMVLSVGCALGAELRLLKKHGFITVGLDPERSFLLAGKTGENADDFIQAIGESIPLHDDSFDLVLLFEVLEHAMKPEAVLKEISRVLKTNGILFLTVPNRFYPFETHGMQICQKQINNLMGIGIPFFSLAPNLLRKRLERARIYSEARVISLLRKNRFEPFIIEYLMPSLDIVQQTSLTRAIRQIFRSLSRVPLVKKLGANIMVISKKRT